MTKQKRTSFQKVVSALHSIASFLGVSTSYLVSATASTNAGEFTFIFDIRMTPFLHQGNLNSFLKLVNDFVRTKSGFCANGASTISISRVGFVINSGEYEE